MLLGPLAPALVPAAGRGHCWDTSRWVTARLGTLLGLVAAPWQGSGTHPRAPAPVSTSRCSSASGVAGLF